MDIAASPDPGCNPTQVFGAKAFVDFWVSKPGSSLAWAVELLCEGDRAKEHQQRFEPGGRYADLPMTNFALIDFRCADSPRLQGSGGGV